LDDLSRLILEAWAKLGPKILADKDELHRRLARRRLPILTRPVRPWCLAIRASDHRITPAHWVISPEHAMSLNHPAHPYEPIEHTVTIQTHALRKFCRPVLTDSWGEEVPDVAKRLGTTPAQLRRARQSGLFTERRIKGLGGKRGHPVPLIHSWSWLDPGIRGWVRDSIWGALWEFLPDMIPDNFEQSIVRLPVFRRNPRALRHPDDHLYKDESQLAGYRWLCPGCKRQVRTIYYPLPANHLFNFFNRPRALAGRDELLLPPIPPPTFACCNCHRVRFVSFCDRNGWNQLIAQLTAGLLFGHEVPPPPSFKLDQQRKRRRIRQLTRSAPRRQQVLRRLLIGWSIRRIARDMQVSIRAILNHVRILCLEEDVPDRHALAAKLNAAESPPLNQDERAAKRRFQVKELLLQGLSYKQIMQQLSLDFSTLNRDTQALYKLYGVCGRGHRARRALAAKLNLPYTTRADLLRQRIQDLRAQNLTWPQIAKKLNISFHALDHHAKHLRRKQFLAKHLAEISNHQI
jgi:DNA-binding NarL/FixJ family response regulator